MYGILLSIAILIRLIISSEFLPNKVAPRIKLVSLSTVTRNNPRGSWLTAPLGMLATGNDATATLG